MEQQAKFKERLEQALKIRRMKPVELHRLTGISESTISQYRSGYAEPKKEKLTAIASALNVDPTWLMGLDVEMECRETLHIKHSELIKAYNESDERTKQAVCLLLGLNEK